LKGTHFRLILFARRQKRMEEKKKETLRREPLRFEYIRIKEKDGSLSEAFFLGRSSGGSAVVVPCPSDDGETRHVDDSDIVLDVYPNSDGNPFLNGGFFVGSDRVRRSVADVRSWRGNGRPSDDPTSSIVVQVVVQTSPEVRKDVVIPGAHPAEMDSFVTWQTGRR
jgi:hypothetical protein